MMKMTRMLLYERDAMSRVITSVLGYVCVGMPGFSIRVNAL